MESKDSYFYFDPKAWTTSPDVMLLTLEQQGAYLMLLCYMWMNENCRLPNKPELLAKLSRLDRKWTKSGSAIMECMDLDTFPGYVTNKRLLKERGNLEVKSEQSRQKGIKSGEVRRANALIIKGGIEPQFNHSSTVVEHNTIQYNTIEKDITGTALKKPLKKEKDKVYAYAETLAIPFSKFWQAYRKPESSKVDAAFIWINLKDEDRTLIMAGIESYVAQFDGANARGEDKRQYQKLATTFLNQRVWDGETYGTNGRVISLNNPGKLVITPEQQRLFDTYHHGLYKMGIEGVCERDWLALGMPTKDEWLKQNAS